MNSEELPDGIGESAERGEFDHVKDCLVARGRVKLPSRMRRRSPPRGCDARQERALEFLVRQGDNGIVWNILSYWRETG